MMEEENAAIAMAHTELRYRMNTDEQKQFVSSSLLPESNRAEVRDSRNKLRKIMQLDNETRSRKGDQPSTITESTDHEAKVYRR
jgi:hypothetical protein